MPRLPADPVGRLAKLEAVRAGLKPKTVLNAEELSKVLGISWRFLKQMIDDDPRFPVKSRGDMGVPWEFGARKVVDHLIKQAHAAQAERERRMAETSRLAGLGPADVSSPGDRARAGSGSAAEMREGAQAISAVVDAQAKVRAEKQAQGRLVDAEKVRALLWSMMTSMQTETLAIAAKMDPAGQWEPGMRAQVEEELRNVLLGVRGKLEAGLEELRGSRS